jgi:hypothetical protein
MARLIGIATGAALALGIMSPQLGADTALAQGDAGNPQVRHRTNPKAGFVNSVPDKVYTREEILNARPLQWAPPDPAGDGAKFGNGFKEEAPVTTEPPERGDSQAPDAGANAKAKRDFADQWQIIEELDRMAEKGLLPDELADPAKDGGATFADDGGIDFGTADIYTAYSANRWTQMWKAFPWKAMGKLLIDGGGYCTAQVISPKNLIVTAAHCVYNGGWYSGWTFVPAERFGAAPYGQYRWVSATILPNWITTGGRRYDVALIKLANNPTTGLPATSYVGHLGWRSNFPYVRNLTSFGYASNLSTQYTSACAAESYFAGCQGTDVLVKGCNMTFGSSGGGWVDVYKPFESGSNNYVEGVVSGPSCTGTFGNTFVGPRFSSANLGVLCGTYGGC